MQEETQEPKNAQEALEKWERSKQYLGDTDPRAPGPQEIYADARRVIEFATNEELLLNEFIPDPNKRLELLSHIDLSSPEK
jgi:hypothetical protein